MSSLITSTHVRSECCPSAGGGRRFCGAVAGDGGLRLAWASGNQGRDAGRHWGSLLSLPPPSSPVASRKPTFRTFYFTPPRKPSGLEKRGRRLARLLVPTFSSMAPGRGLQPRAHLEPAGLPLYPLPMGVGRAGSGMGNSREGAQIPWACSAGRCAGSRAMGPPPAAAQPHCAAQTPTSAGTAVLGTALNRGARISVSGRKQIAFRAGVFCFWAVVFTFPI